MTLDYPKASEIQPYLKTIRKWLIAGATALCASVGLVSGASAELDPQPLAVVHFNMQVKNPLPADLGLSSYIVSAGTIMSARRKGVVRATYKLSFDATNSVLVGLSVGAVTICRVKKSVLNLSADAAKPTPCGVMAPNLAVRTSYQKKKQILEVWFTGSY